MGRSQVYGEQLPMRIISEIEIERRPCCFFLLYIKGSAKSILIRLTGFRCRLQSYARVHVYLRRRIQLTSENHGMIHEELVLHTVHSGNFRIAWYFTIVQSDLRVTAKHMAEAVKLPTLLSNEVVRSNSVMNTLVKDEDDDYKSHIHVLFCRWLMILLHMIIIRSGYV